MPNFNNNNVFTPFRGVATSGSVTSSIIDVRNSTKLATYVRWSGGISGTFTEEATMRIPIDAGPWDVAVARFPITDWTSLNTLAISGSSSALSQSIFPVKTDQPWAFVRHRFNQQATGGASGSLSGSFSTFVSAKS